MSKVLSKKWVGVASLMILVSTSAFAWGGRAAIVFNPRTGGWGSVHGFNTRVGSEEGAMKNCPSCGGVDAYALENGQSGLKETFVYNGWVALAKGNGVWGTGGQHDTEYDAEQSALANCGGEANGCYIIRSLSSYDYQEDIDGVRN